MPRFQPLVCGLLLAACLASGGARWAGAVTAPSCQVPRDILEDDPKLKLTGAALRDKKPLTIVAIGGASTGGTAAGNGAVSGYPHRLEEALRRRHPGALVTVVNRGVPRQTTEEMIARFATDVIPFAPTLVIWETGTVDAVRGNDVDAFADALAKGIAALRQQNFDVLLVNMQYNPSTGSVINFEPYLEAMRHAADLEDVYLFRRYEIMKYWSENGTFDFVDVPKEQRVTLAEQVYQCLGDTLAEAIDYAAE
ncbi:MAG TPA: GDSL-type esterase/lipase family protein [Stellaceae bacterium]|nr:GDSL-type esterase/lipase family protein [Stellaceae bacterium]